MFLNTIKPAGGAKHAKKRVGRGIGSGWGKTAGRGTKGQKARAGGSIPPWFEGGQTPIHVRIPKLRGFKNRFKIAYEVVNVGRIAQLVELGAFEAAGIEAPAGKATKAAPITINQELLRAVGLVSTLDKPLKVLGQGEVSVPLFVVADDPQPALQGGALLECVRGCFAAFVQRLADAKAQWTCTCDGCVRISGLDVKFAMTGAVFTGSLSETV